MRIAEFAGSAKARGERHGELFGAAARESGVMDFFRDYCEREALGGPVPVASGVLDALHRRFAARLSPDARALTAGYCRASGTDERGTLKALVMPDAINYLIGAAGRATFAPTLGCTSVAAWGDYARDGRFVYGRNLDFIGNGLWDKNQLVARHRPDKGIPYVSLSSAGCVLDGITGLNEEGLTVDLHQHISTDVGFWPGGRPILDLGLEVLQFARTIEDAIAIVERNPTTSGWSLVVTHWRQKRGAVLERSPRHFGVSHHRDGRMAFTNTYRHAPLRAREIDAPAFRESSRLREMRAWELLEKSKGRVDATTVASLLGDHLDVERGRVRAFAQCIAYPNNLTSVVMEPESGRMWVGAGPAPMCDSPFVKVSLWGKDEGAVEHLALEPGLSPAQREGFKDYVRAVTSWVNDRDHVRAAEAMKTAVARDPEDPAYRLMSGLFLLQCADWKGAADSFEAGAALPDLPHRSASQRYWRGRALDVLGRRAEAVALYAEAARTATFKPLVAAAQRGTRRRLAPSRRMMPDVFHADAHAY